MIRRKFRRTLHVENLESRELLTAGGPSAEQQYMLWLLNQARTNPVQTADRVVSSADANVQATVDYYHVNLQSVKNDIRSTTPQPPLAWNDKLAAAATGQSQDQANTGVQSHTGSDGSNLDTRLNRAGYTNRTSDGENAYAYSSSVDNAMEAFLIDWGVSTNGHRDNILQPGVPADQAYRDVGIGIVSSNRDNFGPEVITQDFGSQQGEKAQLLGVVYHDPSHSHMYAPGQGQGNVTIQAVNEANGQTASVQTWDQGGYQMPLDPGTYKVTALKGDQVIRSQEVTIGNTNVEVDYDLSDKWQGTPAPAVKPVKLAAQFLSNALPSVSHALPHLQAARVNSAPTQVAQQPTPTPSTDPSFATSWVSWSARVQQS
jgi:uncharacterized protein YkwD